MNEERGLIMLSMKNELPSWRRVSHLLDQLDAMRKESAQEKARLSVSRRLGDEAEEGVEHGGPGTGPAHRE